MYYVLTVMTATMPSLLCFAASAYMAIKDKAPWRYFAGFGFAAGYGGIVMLTHIDLWRMTLR